MESLTCADFLEWSVVELKYYLAMRSHEGTKIDLAGRALVAYEKKLPIRSDLNELENELKKTYWSLLKKYEISDPKKIEEKNWSEELQLWP